MHLHCHLIDIVRDYGPIYSFWLFSFERYNGLLGAVPTNKRNIELQMFRRFQRSQAVFLRQVPALCADMQSGVLVSSISDGGPRQQRGSLHVAPRDIHELLPLIKMSGRDSNVTQCNWSAFVNYYNLCGKMSIHVLSDDETRHLCEMYCIIYAKNSQQIDILPTAARYHSIKLNGEVFGSISSRSRRSAKIAAFWPDSSGSGKICVRPSPLETEWPCEVLYFVVHHIEVDGRKLPHLMANVRWYQNTPDDIKESLGKPYEVWHSNIFLPDGPASFIPVQRFKCKFISAPVVRNSRHYTAIVKTTRQGF